MDGSICAIRSRSSRRTFQAIEVFKLKTINTDSDFTLTRQVQFSETDMAGVLHFSNYFRLMEEVEHAWWRSLGLSVYMTDSARPKISWPRVNVSCEYAAPARFEDVLELRHRIARVGEKSIDHEIEFHHDGKRIALGKMTTVCCAMTAAGFHAVPIPPEIRAKLSNS